MTTIRGPEFSFNGSTGGFKQVQVTERGRLAVYSESQSSTTFSAIEGDAYNITTGVLSGISTADSALLYFKYLDDGILIVDSLIVGIDDADANNPQLITLLRNPTAGTIVSDASAATIANRNFASSNELTNSLIYKAAAPDAETFTDGDTFGIFYANDNSRLYAELDLVMKKGSSLGVKISPALASGNLDCYVALVCHKVDV